MFWAFCFRLFIASIIGALAIWLYARLIFIIVRIINARENSPFETIVYLLLVLLQLYLTLGWSAYCSETARIFSQHIAVVYPWIYFILAFIFCYFALGAAVSPELMANEGKSSPGIAFNFVILIIGFVVFSIFPKLMRIFYGWLLDRIG